MSQQSKCLSLNRAFILNLLCPYLLQTLGDQGKAGFYEGPIAQAIVAAVAKFDGVMTLEDLKRHKNSFEDPINTTYRGVKLWEVGPNTQGIVALIALNILEAYNLKGYFFHIHVQVVYFCFNLY